MFMLALQVRSPEEVISVHCLCPVQHIMLSESIRLKPKPACGVLPRLLD